MLAQKETVTWENRYYNQTKPATIDLNLDSAVKWLHNGAQPTETAKAFFLTKVLWNTLMDGIRKEHKI
jgi:small subunit ribosomal protein S16